MLMPRTRSGTAVFAVSLLIGLFCLFCDFFKNVGCSDSGAFLSIFFLCALCFFYRLELACFSEAPHLWGAAYFFIALNAGCIYIFYVWLAGSAIFTKKRIYRLTKFLTFKKYAYDDVIGYVMKKTSGVIPGKFGMKTVRSYDVEIYLKDYQCISFRAKDESSRKIRHIRKVLQDHHCHKNGRIPKKHRPPYILLS